MSSPPTAPAASQPTSTQPAPDVDAEMADAAPLDPKERDANVASSSTLDHDHDPDQDANENTPTLAGEATTANATQQPQTQTTAADTTSQHHPTLPSRKDITLRDFLSKMDDYAPIIPDAVTAHYLTLAGLPPPSTTDPTGSRGTSTPLPLARLLALATQKFVADVAADAYQYSRIRASNTSAAGAGGLGPLGAGGPGAASGAGGVGGGVGGGAGGAGAAGGKGGQNVALGVQRAGFGGGGQGGSAQGKTVLTMEDLGMAVQEYGVNVRRGEFYR